MDFLRKYFAGQLTSQEESQVQAWLVEHGDDPQVQSILLSIMSEMEKYHFSCSSSQMVRTFLSSNSLIDSFFAIMFCSIIISCA